MISFVYFDVGGVVIKDFTASNKWQELEKDLGIPREKSKDFIEFWNKLELEVCLGRDVETLIPLIKKEFKVKIPNEYSLLDGFVSRFEANKIIWPVIKKIKEHSKVGLLTNMYPHMLDLIYSERIMPDIDWDVVIDSSLEGVTKPDFKIFEIAQKRSGVNGNEILFVENSKRHVEAAKEFGWQTFFYDSSNLQRSSSELEHYYDSNYSNIKTL